MSNDPILVNESVLIVLSSSHKYEGAMEYNTLPNVYTTYMVLSTGRTSDQTDCFRYF